MAQTEADKTFTGARTAKGTRGPVFISGGSSRKKKKSAGVDVAAEQRRMREAQEKAAIERIRKAEQEALTGLERQEAKIAPRFTEARRATTAASALRGQRFAEQVAGQGLTGAQTEAGIRQAGALQRDIGALRGQEAEEFADIARTRAQIGRAAESDIAATRAGIEAQSIQDLINLENQRRQRELQEAQLTGQFRGAPTLAGRSAMLQEQQAGELSEQRRVQTEAARLGLQQQELQNLVAMNMGDLMAAMQQYPVGSPEYNALRVAREEKVRQQETRDLELEMAEEQRQRQREIDELNRRNILSQISARQRPATTTTRTTGISKLPTGFQAEVARRAAALEASASLNGRIPLSSSEIANINEQAERETRQLFGIGGQQTLSEADIDRLIP